MQGDKRASDPEKPDAEPADEFEKAISSLQDLVASAQRSGAGPEAGPSAARPQGQGFAGAGAEPAAGASRQPRLTDVLATGIHEATQSVHELIEANRAAHAHLFGPLSLPSRPGGPRPASSVTADGHLAGALWQLRESIKELQAVSHALLSRI